ncbi:hypothetical protein G7Y79_00094g101270 [Physcia stellaris]|nr:hypothetical protein G7Y79_00094g101270 [Physcia stellaris]
MSDQFSLGGFQLDLGNLEKSSGMIIPDRKRTVSIVDSEDDGPTDFTLNMEKWMKGTGANEKDDSRKGEDPKPETVEQPTKQQISAIDNEKTKNDTERYSPDPYAREEISGFTEPLDSNTPSPMMLRRGPRVEDVPNDSVYPLPAQAYSRITENVIPRAPNSPTPVSRRGSGSGSSAGLPVKKPTNSRRSSPPAPTPDISALQAEIERLRHENKDLRTANISLERDNASYASAYENIERAFKSLDRESEAQKTAYQALERSNAKLQTSFEDLQDRFREQQTAHGAQLQTSQDRETATAAEIQTLESRARDGDMASAAEIQTLKSQLRDRDIASAASLQTLKSQAHDRESTAAAEIQSLESQLRDRDIAATTSIQTLKSQLRDRDTARSHLRQKAENAIQALATTKSALASTQHSLSTTAARLAATETQLSEATAAAEAREEEWRGRVELLFREREKMSKALMAEWGRREVGNGRGRGGRGARRIGIGMLKLGREFDLCGEGSDIFGLVI